MPTLSVWSIRLSLIHLVVAWAIGATMMLAPAWSWPINTAALGEVHVAAALFGWFFQFVIGVAYRMLPTFGRDRGRPVAAWTSIAAINLGVIWTAIGAFGTWAPPVVSTSCWFIAAGCFAWHIWPRVKAFGA